MILVLPEPKKELDDWGQQGVLLLNATLTVQAHQPNSHKDLGWEKFTDYVIRQISEKKENVVLYSGEHFAQKKSADRYFKTSYSGIGTPFTFSVYRGFTEASLFLKSMNIWKQKERNLLFGDSNQ